MSYLNRGRIVSRRDFHGRHRIAVKVPEAWFSFFELGLARFRVRLRG